MVKKTTTVQNRGIGSLMRRALLMWGQRGGHGLLFLGRAGLRYSWARRRHKKCERELNTTIPTVLILSVTMRCNYNCQGCYSRGLAEEEELTTLQLDHLLTEAEEMGFLAVVITGGEPLLRGDILETINNHPRLLFVLITNGSLLSLEMAAEMSKMRNLILLISIEGRLKDTDTRRGAGAHKSALWAMANLKEERCLFGFAATNTATNSSYLGSQEFIDEMMDRGCSLGLITEYVPCGPNPKVEWILQEEKREAFRQHILELSRENPITLVQFPQDEYGEENICTGAGRASLHINAQGGIEPCPFVPISIETILHGGLKVAIQSPFLKAIRNEPRILSPRELPCSLFEHMDQVKEIAKHLSLE